MNTRTPLCWNCHIPLTGTAPSRSTPVNVRVHANVPEWISTSRTHICVDCAEIRLYDAVRRFFIACGYDPPGSGMPAEPRPRLNAVDIRMPNEAWNALLALRDVAEGMRKAGVYPLTIRKRNKDQ